MRPISPVVDNQWVRSIDVYPRQILKPHTLKRVTKMPQEHVENDNSSHPNFANVELADIIDVLALQEMMDDYYALTGIGVGIIDLNGTVLVGTGWQDICVNYHRAVPESCAFCQESDITLSSGVPPGTFKEYRCKNNMWDIATPIMLGDRHIGNIFLGQFLYDDEKPDYDLFRAQARRFGYDEEKYLAALDRVPRWSRETVQKAMGFYSKLARMISKANYNNVILADTLARREEAEKALQLTRISVDTASDALFWVAPDASIVDVNEAACRSLGYTREELLRLRVPDVNTRFNTEKWPQHFAGLRQQGTFTFENEFIAKNGRVFPVEIVANYVKVGNRELNCSFVRDITERKRTKDKIKESEHRFGTLFENMNEGVGLHTFIHNDDNEIIDYRIVSVNHAYETLLGIAKGSVIGKTSREAYNSVDPPYLKEFASVSASQTGFNFETYFTQMEKHFDISVIPWEKNGFATIFSDISERIKNEQQLKQFNKSLEERIAQAVDEMRQKDQMMIMQERRAVMGEMIHNIAHQWRQPLNVLGLYLQDLPSAYGSPEFNREYLTASIDKSMKLIDHMSQTINDFMNFFRSDKKTTTFCVNEVIKRTLSLIEKSFQDHQIRISFQAGGDRYVYGYPNEYSQALLNIIVNARDALDENHSEDARILIQSFAEGDKTVVTITDNAGGIADEIIDRLFDPYFTTKGPDKGTGIGLFMSMTIIENNMGGRLTVRNTGSGAEFRIEV
jgi:PAS domain S-box-containing protein